LKRYLNVLKDVVSNEFVYIFSDILIKAIAFLSMPFFLNVMTTEDFGQYSLYQTYIGIFGIFFGLNVSSAIVRYYVDRTDGKKYLATAIWIVVCFSFVFSCVVLWVQYVFDFFKMESKVVIIIIITTISNCLINVGLEVIRSEKNAKLYGFVSVFNSITSTLFGLILVYSMKNNLAFWRLTSVCSSSLLLGGFLATRLMYKDGVKYNLYTGKYLLSYSIPLIPYSLSTTILAQVNRLFLSRISLSDVGIYSFASNLAIIIYVITLALNRSLQPNLFESLHDNKHYRNYIKKNIIIFYLLYIGFIFGSDILIGIFGNANYLGATKVIPILTLGYGYFFLYSLYINFMYFYKKNFTISSFSIFSAGIVIIANVILIRPFGYIGAALATAVSYFSLFLCAFFYVTKRLSISVFNFRTIFLLQGMLILPVIIKLLL
jgi:O-antigen/teichoic acid export membrane protein